MCRDVMEFWKVSGSPLKPRSLKGLPSKLGGADSWMPPCLMSVPRARSQQLLRFLFFMVVHCLMCRIRYKQSSQNFLQLIPTRESTTHKKTVFLLSAKFDVSPNDLDVEKIDLIGWSSQLVLFQRQMLMIMGSTLVIQDRALQYEYLQKKESVQ